MATQEATKKTHFNYIFFLKTEFLMHGFKKASRLNNGPIHDLRMSHSLQMDIYRRGYDLQMPLGVPTASDTASAYKKCLWAASDTKHVPCGLERGFRGEATTFNTSFKVAAAFGIKLP
jgi:hypothetical protein